MSPRRHLLAPTVLTLAHTGRTTFVNTLCGKKVLQNKDSDDPNTAHIEEGVKIQPVTVGMQTTPRNCFIEQHID